MTGLVAIVVNYGGGEALGRCVASLLEQDPAPTRTLVIDNDSPDAAPGAALDQLPAGVELVRLSSNDGFAAGVAAGLSRSREPTVLTLNPDTRLLPGCLAAATAALEADHQLGSVALRALQEHDDSRLDASGIGITSTCGQINWDHGLTEAQAGHETVEVLGPLGGAALWRRKAIERAGGFDPRFFLYWEDVDMALRLNRAGYTCRTVPEARVLHEGGGSTEHGSSLNVRQMVANHWPCLVGSLPGRVLVRRAPWLAVAPLRAALLYARRGRAGAALHGLLRGLLATPAALWRRRYLHRSGSGHKAAARVTALMAAADRNRLRLKADAPPLTAKGTA